jgi:hypothetical protein
MLLDQWNSKKRKQMNYLTESERVQLAAILEEAARDIVEFGWRNAGVAGPEEFDPRGNYPRCIWTATVRRLQQNPYFGDTKYTEAVIDAITKAAGVSTISQLFDANDSQSEEEGQAWAFGVLITASHTLNPALAHSENTTDTDSTKTDTGSTTNVAIRVLRYLKKFIWVR